MSLASLSTHQGGVPVDGLVSALCRPGEGTGQDLLCAGNTSDWDPRERLVESKRIFKRTLFASALLHALLALSAVWIFHSQFSAQEELLTHQPPELFDISIVPLSALNTVLPQGNTMPEQRDEPIDKQKSPPQPVQEQPKESPPKTKTVKPKLEAEVASPNAEPQKLSPEKHRPQDSSSDLGATAFSQSSSNAAAVLGVPNGDPASTEKARLNYQEAVAALLARSKRYPERALRRGISGDATIRIEIRPDGSVADLTILKSTQFDILDEELYAMVERASPFPSFPHDLDRRSLALVVPVAFTIERTS